MEEQAAGVDIENIEADYEEIDEYGEQVDCSNEYLTVSINKATNPPALCLNTEEVGKVFDEVLAYISHPYKRRILQMVTRGGSEGLQERQGQLDGQEWV